MATGTAPTVRSTHPGRDDRRDRFIQQQVNRARRQLRIIDLGAALLALISGVLAYLLLYALVDHWIWPIGFVGRWFALVLLVVAAGMFTWRFIVPPLIHSVNPLYAARAIEHSESSLKNSLVNFLFLRERPDSISGVVLDTLERTAATDLKRVSVDASIDRTKLIRILYVLTAALALFAFYKMLSPKDPMQSAYRVLMPWSNVAAASRVAILDVEPGDTTGLLNERIQVVARVRGVGAGDRVVVICSSSDRQLVERPVEMTVGADGLTYEASIPPVASGLKQDWTYRVRAGDALSPEYRIKLEAKPLISVQRLELEFPAYTERPRQVLEGQGDIEALEGTKVTIRAKANRPIRSAYVEWDPEELPNRKGPRASAPLDMVSEGTGATAHFVLRMAIDGRTPRHSSYQLRFTTEDGQQNVDPIVHRILVFPDLAPVVEILTPKRRQVEVPENGRLPIEVRALDPDFGLTGVKLVGSAGSDKIFSRDLLPPTTAYRGQFVTKFELVPRELGLVEGDELVYRAVARDNRHDPDGSMAPNEQRTPDYRILVTAPQESTSSKDPSSRPKPETPAPDDSAAQDQEEGESAQEEEKEGEKSEDSAEESPSSDEEQKGVGQPEGGSEGSADSQQGDGQQEGEAGEGQESGAENQNLQGSGATGEPSDEPGEASGDGQSGTGREGSSQGPAGDSEGAEGTSPGDPTPNRGGSAQPDGRESDGGEGGEPRSPDDLHDGEIFDIVRRRLEQQSGQPSGPGRESEGTETANDDRQIPEPGEQDSQNQDAGSDGAERGDQPSPRGDEAAGGVERTRAPGEASPEFGDQRPREADDVESESGIDPETAAQDRPQGGGERGPPSPNEGGESDGVGKPQDQGETRTPDGDKDGAQDGAGENSQSGAGTRTNDETGQGTTPAEFENRDRNKTEQPDSGKEEDVAEPSGISVSDHQSDSKGDKTSGDQSGGGGQGAGQSAQLPGADSAGSQQAADEGSGAAQESGAGETASDPGGKEQAGGPTGTAGTEAGDGSTSRPQPDGGDPGAASSPASPDVADNSATDSTGAGSRQDGTSGIPAGGGIGSDDPRSGSQQQAPPLVKEKEQLDYAHHATDLALEHLRNQQQNPDQGLLDELGWSREDLAEFVRRWDRLKRSSAASPDARRELDESLKSLGLRPPQDVMRRGTTAQDAQRGNADDALRSAPPAKYFEQFNAFRKGAARSADE